MASRESWPEIPLAEWEETKDTLHMWTQVVGKIRLALTPTVNHFWNCPLYVSSRGLTTSAIPFGRDWFDMEFDFLDHVLRIRKEDGSQKTVKLAPRSVKDFHRETMATLKSMGITPKIWLMPVEVADPIRFDQDETHHSYDAEAAQRFWKALAQAERVLTEFRAEFLGKCSPVHFFWGSFDLAVTRFSGRPAPPRPGADSITREAYSHEVSSVGFWSGGRLPSGVRVDDAVFYSYAAPEPEGFKTASVKPSAAFYSKELGEFLLNYDDVRKSSSPDRDLRDFAETTYTAAADLAHWDRASLERASTRP